MEVTCSECNATLPLKVIKSAAGYYVGYICPKCGPYDRISLYFTERKEAMKWLVALTVMEP
jgi:hypothetical protein